MDNWALDFIDIKLKSDRDIILIAMQLDGYALSKASNELRNDKEFILEATKLSCSACDYSLIENYSKFEEIIDLNNLDLLKECNGFAAEFYKMKHPEFILN